MFNGVLKNCICIEGIDGSGKSTIAKWLQEELGNTIVADLQTSPYFPKSIEYIRSLLGEEFQNSFTVEERNKALLYAFISDFTLHESKLKEYNNVIINNNKVILLDRYLASTYSYQSLTLGTETVEKVIRNANLSYPEFTIYLKVNPVNALGRVEKRGIGKEMFEKREILEKSKNFYEDILRKIGNTDEYTVYEVNADVDENTVREQVKKIFTEIYNIIINRTKNRISTLQQKSDKVTKKGTLDFLKDQLHL